MELFPIGFEDLIRESEAIYRAAYEEYKPSKVFALFSGGDDSLSSTLFASKQEGFTGCIHINTGTGIRQTSEYVRETCSKMRWPLVELHPTEKSYEEFVLEHGFPGPAAHRYCYIWLKEKPLRWFVANVAKNSTHDRVMLITGVRLQESTRRMGHVEKVMREGSRVWTAPLLYWSKLDCLRWIASQGVARNPVAELLHGSKECNCGAYANNETSNELEEIRLWYPETAGQIDALQVKAKAAGVHCKWGVKPPEEPHTLTDLDMPLLMCQGCGPEAA